MEKENNALKITIEGEPKEIAALVLAVQERHESKRIQESLSETGMLSNFRRLEQITNNPLVLYSAEEVIKNKKLSLKDIGSLLFSFRVRHGFRPEDFGI